MDTTTRKLMLCKLMISPVYNVGGDRDLEVYHDLFPKQLPFLLVLMYKTEADETDMAWGTFAEDALAECKQRDAFHAEYVRLEGNIIFLIQNTRDTEEAFLTTVCDWVNTVLEWEQGQSIYSCISGISTEISNLPILYSQVIHTLQMMIFSASKTRLWLPSQMVADRNAPSVYNKELNQRLFQKLIHYDFEAALECLHETVRCATENVNTDIGRFKEELFFLLETAAYMLGFRINKANQMPDISPAFMGDFVKAQTAAELVEIAERFIGTMREMLNINKGGSVDISAVLRYIENNYGDPTVTATAIAAKFHKNLAHLSRQFKYEMNINLSTYLRRFRLDRAKQLLWNTDLTIDQIAGMTGWSSSKTFYRVFQDQEGTTPKRYRITVRSENSNI